LKPHMRKKKTTSADKTKKALELAGKLPALSGEELPDVARRLGVTEKELIRLAETLSMCGLPPYTPDALFDVYIDENNRIHARSPVGLLERPVQLSGTEGLALLLAGRASAGARTPALSSALEKIRAAMNPAKLDAADRAAKSLDIAPETGGLDPLLDTISAAAADSVKLEMEYFTPSRGKVSARVVRPYGLIYNVDRWLIVGWCEMRGETRVFRADRVKSARATVEIFERPPGFDLETFRRDEMFKHIERTIPVRLRFSGGAAGWACRRWPERARSDADGSASVEFRADRLENIVGMMLSLGPEAQVVSPPELKTLVASAASAALSLYV